MAFKDRTRKPDAGCSDQQGPNERGRGRAAAYPSQGRKDGIKARDAAADPAAPPRKAGFMERLQRHMSAIVYAEAGEYQSAQEFLEPSPRRQTILLVIEGEAADQSAIAYSLGLCKRMNAELDILQVIEKSEDDGDFQELGEKMVNGSQNLVALARMADEMNVPFKLTMRIGEVSEKLVNYAKRHKDVAMIVLDSPKTRTAAKPERTWENLLQRLSQELSVPVTTVLAKPATAGSF